MWELITRNDHKQLEKYLSSIKKKKTLTNLLCSRNEIGNTPILEAIRQGKEKILRTLLDYAGGMSINVQDVESGYSPLHKSLLKGDLRNALLILANSNVDYKVKDKEGMTFLEMLEASIKLPKVPTSVRSATIPEDMDTSFGSEDEVSVYEHELSAFESPSSAMSIWTWGSNNNYLLGSGLSDSRSIPEQLSLFGSRPGNVSFGEMLLELDPQIIMMASSKYHVAILTKSNLYVYGFGIGGRLGLGNEETQLRPRIVTGIVGTISVVAIGADHSLAITEEGKVWAWGSNAFSQLGIAIHSEKSLIPQEVLLKKTRAIGATASKYHSAIFTDSGCVYTWGTNNGQLGYDRPVQNYPKKITSFSIQPIIQIASTENSTAILVESKQVIVFCKYQTITLSYPHSIAPAILRSRSFKQPFPVTIKAGDNDVGVILSSGDVCLWHCSRNELDKLSSKTKRVWSATRKNRIAIDCTFGVDSQIAIVTSTGHVFIGSKRSSIERDSRPFKFVQTPNLEHISSVVGSSSGSYAAIRSDFRFPQLIDDSKTFAKDIRTIFGGNRTDYDCFFVIENEEKIFAHRIILVNRSKWLRNLFTGDSNTKMGDFGMENGLPFLRLSSICSSAMKLMIEFLYTGRITKPCENFSYFSISVRGIEPGMIRIHDDLKKLVKHFQLDETEILQSTLETSPNNSSPIIYDMDFGMNFANVIIDLQDGFLKTHSVLLSTRCEYFEPILGKKSYWKLSSRDQTPVIDLSHIPVQIFQVLLKWIVTDSVNLFSEVRKDSLSDWFDFIRKVQIFADELLLFKISDICSALLARFVTIRNVLELLEHSMVYNSLILTEACLDFVIRNIETFLKRGALQSSPADVVIMIEKKLKQLQREKLPLMLGECGYYSKLLQEATVSTEEQELKRISSLESINSAYLENSSPSMRPCGSSSTQFTISPLLMPINVFPSRTYDAASSMEDLHLNSSWIESKIRRKNSLQPSMKPPLASPSSATCYGHSFDNNSNVDNSIEYPYSQSKSNKSPKSHYTEPLQVDKAQILHNNTISSPQAQYYMKNSLKSNPNPSELVCKPQNDSTLLASSKKMNGFGKVVGATSQLTVKFNQNSTRKEKSVKLSQKERKRLNQNHLQTQPTQAPLVEVPIASPAWTIPIPSPKKDLLTIQMEEVKLKSFKNTLLVSNSRSAGNWSSPSKPVASFISIQNEQLETKTAAKREKAKSFAEILAEEIQLQEYQMHLPKIR